MKAFFAFCRSLCSSATWQQVSVPEKRLLIGILLLHFLLSGWMVSRIDFTCDEFGYYGWAVRWAQGHQERILPVDDSKTPIVAPSLVPIVAKKWLQPADDAHGFMLLQIGRWFMYIYQLLGAFVLFAWLYRLWGSYKWVLPLLLYLYDPLVFSYSMIVGSDLPSTSLLLASFYFAWRYWQSAEKRDWVRMCMAVSLAILAKASMVYLLPMLMLAFWLAPAAKTTAIRWPAWQRWGLLLLCIWLCIQVAYLFEGSFFPLSQLPQKSAVFQQLAAKLQAFSSWPVPLPYHYVSGFDLLKFNEELGGGANDINSFIGVYFNGEYFTRGPVWYYYAYVFVYKWPLACWALLVAALWLLRKHLLSVQHWRKYVFIWLPLVAYAAILSFTNPFQIGMRHAMLLMPGLYFLVGYSANRFWVTKKRLMQFLLLFYALSWLSYWPNMLSYTNELIWHKEQVYEKLYDSSVSYCQAEAFLQTFLQKHPEYKRPGTTPAAGKFAVELEAVANPLNARGLQWLLQLKKPSGHYMHVVLLYEVTEADLQKARSKVSGK